MPQHSYENLLEGGRKNGHDAAWLIGVALWLVAGMGLTREQVRELAR
jgi:hypothetical protein